MSALKVRKTQGGGWTVFAFSSFSLTEVTDQKQIEFSFWSDNQNLNAADKPERERRKTQSNYTGSFHKPKVVLSPLHFQGEFTKNVISDYNCSMLQIARDFKLLKHKCKRFPMLRNTVKRLPMLKHNCKRLLLLKHTSKRLLIKQNYKEVCLSLNTWYTISGVHNTNQIQTLKTLEFLRYEFW